jgi:hypothetical protein
MMDREYGQMSPLYEAMSVCSSTIGWIEGKQRERSDWELHAHLSKLGLAIRHFLDSSSRETATPNAPEQQVEFMVCCLAVVTALTTRIIQWTRSDLHNTSERFRDPIAFLLNQIEEMMDRVEDISEAWAIPLDRELSAKVKSAICQIDSTKTDIPDWREALELISD